MKKKIEEPQKSYALYLVRLKSSLCKCVYNDKDLQLIKPQFIAGMCAGLASAGISCDRTFVSEMHKAWENEPPYIK
jgi:hypothetical protein